MEITYSNEQEFLAAREGKIGSSAIPVIMGISPFESPLTLWARMLKTIPPLEDNPQLLMGRLMEPVIARLFEDQYKLDHKEAELEKCNSVYIHDEFPTLSASPDYIGRDGQGQFIVECKNSRAASHWEAGRCPDYAYLQAMWQMGITGIKRAFVVGLLNNVASSLKVVEVSFDAGVYNQCLEAALDFAKLVETKTQPDITAAADYKVLASLSKLSAERVDLTNRRPLFVEAARLAKDIKLAKASLSTLEDAYGKIKGEILNFLGDHEAGVCGDFMVFLKKIQRKSYMVKASERVDVKFVFPKEEEEEDGE